MFKAGKTPEVDTAAEALYVTPRAFRMPSTASTFELLAGTASRKTQVFDATRDRTVVITPASDVWAIAGPSPTAAPPAAGAAADQTGIGAGGVLLIGGAQVPFCVQAGHALAFVTRSGQALVTYTVL